MALQTFRKLQQSNALKELLGIRNCGFTCLRKKELYEALRRRRDLISGLRLLSEPISNNEFADYVRTNRVQPTAHSSSDNELALNKGVQTFVNAGSGS